MVSKAWKDHERYVAKVLGGRRQIRTDYGSAQPDVIVDDISVITAALGPLEYRWNGGVSLLVECKYSIDQTWQKKIEDLVKDAPGPSIVAVGDLLVWELGDTPLILHLALSPKRDIGRLLDSQVSIIWWNKKVPTYINQWLTQAESYSTWSKGSNWIPIVCLAQKQRKKRIVISRSQNLLFPPGT